MYANYQKNRQSHSLDSILSLSPISKEVKTHLTNVYLTLSIALLSSTLGILAHLKYFIGNSILSYFGVFGFLIALFGTPTTPYNLTQRLGLLLGFSFFQGALIGPLIQISLMIDPSLIFVAFGATFLVFASFSLASIFANQERTYLFWGGALSSAISMLFWISIVGMFIPGFGFNIQLYGGLLVFVGYVLYDTQLVILKRELGDTDFVKHSVELFIDFVAIFVRILIILLKNSDKKKKEGTR